MGRGTSGIFVGKERYARMLPAMKRILRTLCYLYIWQFLEDARKDNAFTTPVDLMQEWKTQIIQHGEQKNIHADAIESFLNALLSLMQETPCVPEMALPGNQQVQEFLISENVLYKNEGCLAFVHQSMADYLNVECWLQDILHRKRWKNFCLRTMPRGRNIGCGCRCSGKCCCALAQHCF